MPVSANERPVRDGQSVIGGYQQLREAILRGVIPAGETTSQASLSEQFGIGRTPLREALRMLQREGLVVSEPNRRVQIADLTSTDAEQLYIMRVPLEAVAIKLTVPTLKSADFAELEGLMAQMEHYQRKGDRYGHHPPHRAFHMLLLKEAGSRALGTIGELFDHAERYRLAYGSTTADVWETRRREHRAIVEAAASGDADGAAVALVGHYARTAALVAANMNDDGDPHLSRLRIAIRSVAPEAESALDNATAVPAGRRRAANGAP
jgi:DNA-binding GntR family transcriptional regulator